MDKEILKGYEFAFYPSKSQKKQLAHWFGGIRWVYNYYLSKQITEYNDWKQLPEDTRGIAPYMNYVAMAKNFTQLKCEEDKSWLRSLNVVSVQETLKNLEVAYRNFFAKRGGFPSFKSRENRQSVSVTYRGFSVKNGDIYVARRRLRLRGGRPLEGTPMRLTIVKEVTGKYYVRVLCRVNATKAARKTKTIGLDMGIKDFAVDSTGKSYALPVSLNSWGEKLKRAQQKLSSTLEQIKKTESEEEKVMLQKLREKKRIIIAKIHTKIKNIRKDFLHKLSRKIVDSCKVIGIESLQIAEMVEDCKQSKSKKHNLPRLIMSSCWQEFFRQLEYKAKWSGNTTVVRAGEYFPSTQIHNRCGVKSESQIPLKHRQWYCHHCKEWVNRDHNAAKNLESLGVFMRNAIPKLAYKPLMKSNARTAIWI